MRRFEMSAEQRMLLFRAAYIATRIPWIVSLIYRVLHPTAHALPGVQRETDIAAPGRIDAAPVNRVSQAVKRAERPQHHRAFFFLAPHRRHHGAFVAEVMKSLLNAA